MHSPIKSLIIPLILSFLTLTHSRPSPENHLQLPSNREKPPIEGSLYCHSWRYSIETNDAGNWPTIPRSCINYVVNYMFGDIYFMDSKVTANDSLDYANSINLGDDGKDVWVFDIDETLLSNLPFYEDHGFGMEEFDEDAYSEWKVQAKAPALPASLNLYKQLQNLGFTIFLLTGRTERYRNATEINLRAVGYDKWERLFLRGPEDEKKLAVDYKSEIRKKLVGEGYRILGNSGDQWSDLHGEAVANRSFKLPNPMYYIA